MKTDFFLRKGGLPINNEDLVEDLQIMGTPIANDMAKIFDHVEFITQEQAAAFLRLAVASSLEYGTKSLKAVVQKETNNWRKMHGYPMRRKGGRSHAKHK